MKKKIKSPTIHPSVFVHKSSVVIGDVTLHEGVSLWPGAVVRGDYNRIEVGKDTNIQDLCVLHITEDLPCLIGEKVTIGHGAIIHACKVEDHCLIGMGAILLDGCEIGGGSWVAAGSLVPPGVKFPPAVLIMGSPAKVIRELSKEELNHHLEQNRAYAKLAQNYRNEGEEDE